MRERTSCCTGEDACLPWLSLLFPPSRLGQFSLSLYSISLFLRFCTYLETIFTIMCHQLCNPLINLHTCEPVSTSFVQKRHTPVSAKTSHHYAAGYSGRGPSHFHQVNMFHVLSKNSKFSQS